MPSVVCPREPSHCLPGLRVRLSGLTRSTPASAPARHPRPAVWLLPAVRAAAVQPTPRAPSLDGSGGWWMGPGAR